jgi:pSer/pThr/pTyr-binding forkhead associated (FHA) protein
MVSRILLTAIEGDLKGQAFEFRDRAVCLVGRARDCSLRIPYDRTVSHYHCLLDLDTPDPVVCDLGSLNGTYVNGEKIGQRDRDEEANPGVAVEQPGRMLAAGDEIRVGDTVFRVQIIDPSPTTGENSGQEASSPANVCMCR